MNDDLVTGTITLTDSGDFGIYNGSGITAITMPVGMDGSTVTTNNSYGAIAMGIITDELLDKWSMNRFTVDHKVQEQELIKLKEVAPDYAKEIKENLAKNATRDIINKMTFSKKHDKDADVHHFIGRVWCFTEEELKSFIEEIKNA